MDSPKQCTRCERQCSDVEHGFGVELCMACRAAHRAWVIAGDGRNHRNQVDWRTLISACVSEHGCVTSRMLVTTFGMTREKASWTLGFYARKGLLKRIAPGTYRMEAVDGKA